MTLPTLTRDQQHAAIRRANQCRRDRAALLADLKTGRTTLAVVLDRDDDLVRRTRVAVLIRALPGVGTVKTSAILAAAGVPEGRRVAGVGHQQKRRLIAAVASLEHP